MRFRRRDRAGELKVYQNSEGDWCLGNKFCRLRVADKGVDLWINPDTETWPVDMSKLLFKLVKVRILSKDDHQLKLPLEFHLPLLELSDLMIRKDLNW